MRILLVEDHADTARVYSQLLTSLGHAVRIAPDCQSARSAARDFVFDLLICDISLPDGDGRQLLPELRHLAHSRLPALAFSAYASAAEKDFARMSGFDDFLAKPADFDQLMGILNKLARGNGHLRV